MASHNNLNYQHKDTLPLTPLGSPSAEPYSDHPHTPIYGAHASGRDSLNANEGVGSTYGSSLALKETSSYVAVNDPAFVPSRRAGKRTGLLATKRSKLIAGGGALLLIIIAAAVAGGVAGRSKANDSAEAAVKHSGNLQAQPPTNGTSNSDSDAADIGRNGSMVTTENGQTFIYNSTYGGTFCTTPFRDAARARSDVPALNEEWDYSTMLIQGVGLGGWLVPEPFIVPQLYEPFANATTPAIDEWTLMQNLGTNASAVMTEHYDTFITEIDFAQIAGAGLTWVRLALPYWAIQVYDDEPFLEGVAWQYFLKATTWARKYGLRMELELHTVPGSQNGYNHSGKFGNIGFMRGTMGIANAQRTLSYIQSLAQFVSQPEYVNVIPMLCPVNEALWDVIGEYGMKTFHLEAYNVIRAASGIGKGNGPNIVFQAGGVGLSEWAGFMNGADRVMLEDHPYLAFSPPSGQSYGSLITRPCQYWAASYNTSMNTFGFTFNGEWCLATTDCGLYVNGVNLGTRYEGTFTSGGQSYGDCSVQTDYENYSDAFKLQMRQMARAYQDMSRNWFFWTWKIGASSQTGKVEAPQWSYSLGLQNNYIPADPRPYQGSCSALAAQLNLPGQTNVQWSPPLDSWMTGGAGAGSITASATAGFSAWPPTSIVGAPNTANLPTMTATGVPITMPTITPTASASGSGAAASGAAASGASGSGVISQGDGWANTADTMRYNVKVSGCSYPNAFATSAPVPSARCTG